MGDTKLLNKSSQFVSQEVSDLWKATTPDPVNISDTFSQKKFTDALQYLKPGKASGPDSICQELIIHAVAALKSWLRDFLFSYFHQLKIPQSWKRALGVAIPNPINYLCIYKILKRLIYAALSQLY